MNKTRLEDVKDKKTGLPVIHPETGDVQKREVFNRRAGYDFTFSVPESVSLYLAVNEDKFLEQMIAAALDETMATIEAGWKPRFARGISTTIALAQTWSMQCLFTARPGPSMGSPTPIIIFTSS